MSKALDWIAPRSWGDGVLKGALFLLLVNGVNWVLTVIVRGLPYANASTSILMQSGERTLTAHSSDGTQLLARVPVTLDPGIWYTAYLYGEFAPYKLLVVEDQPLYNVGAPSFRVINLSTEPGEVGAGIAPYIEQPPTPLPAEGEEPSIGYSIPVGIERLGDNVPVETATEFQYMRAILEAYHTIFVLDADLRLVVLTMARMQFSANMAYDIVIFKTTTAPMRAFIINYPPA